MSFHFLGFIYFILQIGIVDYFFFVIFFSNLYIAVNFCFLLGKFSFNERNLIIARVVFELILVKNLKLAYKFISKYIDKTDNFNNNPPALNFAFMLVSLITRAMHDFDHFWALINIYKGVCEQEYYIQYYLNKISIMYYNRPFLKEEDNSSFNLMNIMKSFGFGGGQ